MARERRYVRPDRYTAGPRQSAYHAHQYNRSSTKNVRNVQSYVRTVKMVGLIHPGEMGVTSYWKQRRKLASMGVTKFSPRSTGVARIASKGNGFVRKYGFQIAAGAVVAEASYLGAKRIHRTVQRRRAAKRTAAGHNYQNQPPRLTRAQRQQMARRRRRVRGRFA